jgi:hypothetical protein
MIAKIKSHLIAFGLAMLAFWGLYGIAFTRGQKSGEVKRVKERLETIKTAKEIENEIQNDPYFVDRASRWLRDDKKW